MKRSVPLEPAAEAVCNQSAVPLHFVGRYEPSRKEQQQTGKGKINRTFQHVPPLSFL